MENKRHPSSFRDPRGFIFVHENEVYRHIDKRATEEYDSFYNSELYNKLLNKNLLLPFEEASSELSPMQDTVYKVIKPVQLDFITYPSEWCFEQLKDAALATDLSLKSRTLF